MAQTSGAPARSDEGGGWSLTRRLSVVFIGLAVLIAALATLETFALQSMNTATNVSIARIDPAEVDVQAVINDLTEETDAVRAYLLSGNTGLLFDYNAAPQLISTEASAIRSLIGTYPKLRLELDQVVSANLTWRSNWAEPSIGLKNKSIAPTPSLLSGLLARTGESNLIVQQANQLGADLQAQSTEARDTLNAARTRLEIISIIVLIGIILASGGVFLGLRSWVARPLAELDVDVRAVAGGELHRALDPDGPPEIAGLARSVAVMRDRILSQLDAASAANAELAEQAEALRVANADLDQFADVASHDLQEPLRKVAGFCDLLMERYGDRLDDRGLEFVRYAAEGSRRMQNLIDDLLSFSRVTRTNARCRRLELAEVVAAVQRRLDPGLEEVGARVTVGELGVVDGDPALLAQLFSCLIDNAIRYRSARPLTIELTGRVVEHDGQPFVAIDVVDNGSGIQPEYAERVFGIFQRLRHDNATATGIGLALCRRIVEVHSGRIWVDTGRVDGATIHLELPASSGPAFAEAPVSSSLAAEAPAIDVPDVPAATEGTGATAAALER